MIWIRVSLILFQVCTVTAFHGAPQVLLYMQTDRSFSVPCNWSMLPLHRDLVFHLGGFHCLQMCAWMSLIMRVHCKNNYCDRMQVLCSQMIFLVCVVKLYMSIAFAFVPNKFLKKTECANDTKASYCSEPELSRGWYKVDIQSLYHFISPT